MSKGMQVQVSVSEILFFLNSVLFLLFSYKTTCTWSNQFCSVQTTKIPVLHYQILHIQNIYKAQVKNYSFLLLDHKRCPLTRWSALLWLSKVCEHTWKFKADKKQKRQRLIYQQRPNLPIPSLRLLPVRTVVVRMKRPSVPLWGFPPPSSYLCFPTFDKFKVVAAMGGELQGKDLGQNASTENLCWDHRGGWRQTFSSSKHSRVPFSSAATYGTACSVTK